MLFPKVFGPGPSWDLWEEWHRQCGKRERMEKKAAFQVKVSPQFKGQFWAGRLRWGLEGAATCWNEGASNPKKVQQSLTQQSLFRDAFLWYMSIELSKSSIVFSSVVVKLLASSALVSANLALIIRLHLSLMFAFLWEDCSSARLNTSGSGPSVWSAYPSLNLSFQVHHNHCHNTSPLPCFWTASLFMGLASVS